MISNADLGALGKKSALETPFNVTNYTAQLVLDQQSETIGDVLKNAPSVRTTYGSGNQAELFVIRGFALNGDDVAIDGLYGVTPRQIVSPELYENIQVLNGANAFLFGAAPGGSGIGGGINLIPKRATKTLLRATASYGAKSVFGGNFDAGTRFGADDAFGIRINGVYRDGETSVDRERRGVRVVGASFDYRKGPGRFFLDFGYEDQRAYQPRPEVKLATTALAVPTVPQASANYGQAWTYTKLRDIYTLARGEVDITPTIMAYIAAGFRDGREDGDYSTLTITNSATGAATQSRLFVPREDNNESGKIGIRGKTTIAGISNDWSVGASANYTENRNAFAFGAFPSSVRGCGATAASFCTNLYTPVAVDKPANGTTGGNLANLPRVSKSAFTSMFLSDTLGVLDDRVLVTVGARRQNMIIDGFDRATLMRTTHYAQTVTTPVVGLILRPTHNLSFYANRIEGLTQVPNAPTNATITNPGAAFPPFKSKQYEVGAKYIVKGLTATLALYQTKQPNAYSKNTPTTTNPLATTYVIEGQQRNRGIEFSLNGEPTDYLRFIGGITITDARLTNTLGGATDGNRAIGVPDYQANLGAEVVPYFFKNATLTARVVRTGTQYLDVTNLQKLSGWTHVDLGLRYVAVAAKHPITFRLSAENIANTRYWSSAFGGYLLQGQPRTIKSSLTFEY